ncbi:MAG: FtsX-like permease family protein [Pseudomonadota bacterium]
MKTLKKKRTVKYTLNDIPLEQESGRRHLPILMCLLVFLLILVLAAATSIGGALSKWQNPSGQKKITIEITQDENALIDINRVTQLLPKIPGVTSFEIVSNDKMLLLLKPWLGDTDNLKDLKLPILIDIELDPKNTFNVIEAQRLLKEIVPNIRLESHAKWQQNLVMLASSLRMISFSIIGFIVLAILIIVSVMTRASLNIHKSTIDTLRLMGARNRYISSYFQNSSFYLCLKGGMLGLAIAIPAVVFLSWLSQRFGVPKLFTLESQPWSWALIVFIPLIISFLAMFVSRLAVTRTLMRMDA